MNPSPQPSPHQTGRGRRPYDRWFRSPILVGLVLVILIDGAFSEVWAGLWLPQSLSDHILFQQNEPIVLWGKADPGSKINIMMIEVESQKIVREAHVAAEPSGRWKAELKSLKASFRTYGIKITTENERRLIHDAIIGELWLTGGQSNMDLPLRYIIGGSEMITAAKCDTIRIFYQRGMDQGWWKSVPRESVEDALDGRWLPANGTNVAECSGVAYTFALALHDALNKKSKQVPIGVMNTAVGATAISSWISRTVMESDSELKSKLPEHWNVGEWKGYYQPWSQATALFNLKIAPLTNHAVRGFLWYQGESDAGFGEAGAAYYKKAQSVLISDWRNHWGGKQRPFILSQLHAYDDGGKMPVEKLETWAFFREAQFEVAQSVPNTATIAIQDVPLTWDYGDFAYKGFVHPLEKKAVGERTARAARALAYGESVEYRGPMFDRLEIAGANAVVYFKRAKGLKVVGNGSLHGFAICGADRRFVEADARIAGETVLVGSPAVMRPVAVTYGFTSMNHCANLFNGENLPAFPFRSDKVKSSYLKGCTDDHGPR
jgi:sialate O-acetylesterase